MMKYEVHLAVELPFWMALPADEFSVVLDGKRHRIKTSNEVVRMDAGDFYRRPNGYLVVWVDENGREAKRRELEDRYPELPVFQRKTKTVVTHIRDVRAQDDTALRSRYDRNAAQWIEESIDVANRLIDSYRSVTSDATSRREAANVSKWELVSAIVSFWEGTRQVGGTIQPLAGPAVTAPPLLPDEDVQSLRRELGTGKSSRVAESLLQAAGSHIPRGAYRNAIIDAVTALEIAAEEAIRKLGRRKKLPKILVDYLVSSSSGVGSFERRCKNVIPALGGPSLPHENNRLWDAIKKARDRRRDIVHKGEAATETEALDAVSACAWGVRKLRELS
ncbi:MAG: hypothetical protein MUP15_06535 [Dehalococcoidia bacterium]|nr:hypothetical protein [Dehalococcoidia bacterium]